MKKQTSAQAKFWWLRNEERKFLLRICNDLDRKYSLFDSKLTKEKNRYDYANNCAIAEQVWAKSMGLA